MPAISSPPAPERLCLTIFCLALWCWQCSAQAAPAEQNKNSKGSSKSKLTYTKLPGKILGSTALLARRDIDRLNLTLASKPNDSMALTERARCYIALQDIEHAAQDCEKALQINAKLPEAGNLAYTLVDAYNRDLDEEHALHFLGLAINVFPNESRLYAERGELLHGMRRSEEGLKDETKAITLDPDNVKAYFSRGEIETAMNRPKDAIVDFNKASHYKLLAFTSLLRLAQCYEAINDWKDAAAAYGRITPLSGIDQSDRLKAKVRRGMAFVKMGDTDNAIKEFSEVIATPRERTMKLERTNPAGEQSAALQERAAIFNKQTKYALAIKDYTMLIGLDAEWGEHTPKWFSERAKLYRLTGKNDLAIRDEQLAKAISAKK